VITNVGREPSDNHMGNDGNNHSVSAQLSSIATERDSTVRSSSSSSPSEPADTIATTDTRGGDPTLASVGETELGFDQIFELLSNQRRRYVLQYLQEIDDQPTTSDLAEQIAAWENDKERQQISSDERKRAYVGLYQGHLPKMDDMGVISYNKPRGTIESANNIDQVSAYLDNDERTDRLSTKYYVGLSNRHFQ